MFIEPVFGKKFFGREEVLGTLQKRVTSLKGGYRQNMALTGPMLAGKSSILRHFLKSIKNSELIPLYIELDGIDFKVFCNRFMATLLFEYLKSEGDKCKGDFSDLKKESRSRIPDTMKHIDEICRDVKSRKENKAYEKLLELPSIFKDETGKSCIVILDEFHNISNFRLRKPYQVFGKFIMVQKNTMYIVSSSQKTLLKEILSKRLSLLFGNFEVIEVNGFDNQTARSFMSDKLSGSGAEDDIKNYLIQVSEGSPFYLEVMANKFSELMAKNDERYNATECLIDIFSELLYDSAGVLNQYFSNNVHFFLEKKNRKKFIPILISLAEGNATIKNIQKDIGKVDKELSLKLQQLQEMDLVYNSGVFYKITDKLFEYWLKYVYKIKSRSMLDDMEIKYLEFKEAIAEDHRKCSRFNSQNIEDIVYDLFCSFRGEKVQVNMKHRKMPYFDKVEMSSISDSIFEVKGTIDNKKWICYIKQDSIAGEQDVWDLWKLKPRNKNSKIVRKIFINFQGMEQNAFLLAKEQGIWVWDLKELNKILRLFGKYEIVL